METFYFEGKIEPDVVPLTLEYTPRITVRDSSFSPDAEFRFTVIRGRIRIRVTTESTTDGSVQSLFFHALDGAKALVETAGFIKAVPYSVAIERAILSDGEVKLLSLGDRSLAATHDFSMSDHEALTDLAMVDLKLALMISDVLMTLGKPHYSPIACGRVADGIARLLAPDVDRKVQWEEVRKHLRVDEDYLRSLSNVSKASRHADRKEVPAELNQESAHRIWALVGRFLQYRMKGPLDPELFPVLEGSKVKLATE
jgi:hypothetical protein